MNASPRPLALAVTVTAAATLGACTRSRPGSEDKAAAGAPAVSVRIDTLIVRQGSVPDPGRTLAAVLPKLGACFEPCDAAKPERGELAVRLAVGENGGATSIDVLSRKDLDACVFACVEPELSKARFNRPLTMPAAVEVYLVF